MIFGKLLSCWDGKCSGAILNFKGLTCLNISPWKRRFLLESSFVGSMCFVFRNIKLTLIVQGLLCIYIHVYLCLYTYTCSCPPLFVTSGGWNLLPNEFTQRLLSPPLKGRCGWRQAAAKCAPWSVFGVEKAERKHHGSCCWFSPKAYCKLPSYIMVTILNTI